MILQKTPSLRRGNSELSLLILEQTKSKLRWHLLVASKNDQISQGVIVSKAMRYLDLAQMTRFSGRETSNQWEDLDQKSDMSQFPYCWLELVEEQLQYSSIGLAERLHSLFAEFFCMILPQICVQAPAQAQPILVRLRVPSFGRMWQYTQLHPFQSVENAAFQLASAVFPDHDP